MASVLGYLLSSLGDYAYATGRDKVPANRIVGLFHSVTWVSSSFKGNDGVSRVVIASSALSMGVHYPDVKYVVHLGPATSVGDHIQQAGRAGRNGSQAFNVVLFHGQQLGSLRYLDGRPKVIFNKVVFLRMCRFWGQPFTLLRPSVAT